MDTGLASVLVAVITVVGVIWSAYINKKGVAKAEKSIKDVSESLSKWELLYEHDENGNQIGGVIGRLIEAVGKAYQIKIKIYQAKNRFDMMDAQWVFVENNLVHASNTDQISLIKDPSSENYIFLPDAYHYFVVVNSEGYHHASRIFIDGRKGNSTSSKRRMAWFGLVPPGQ